MTRKELGIIYGLGKDKIRELLREAGVSHQKELLYNDVVSFVRHAGKPVRPSEIDRLFDNLPPNSLIS